MSDAIKHKIDMITAQSYQRDPFHASDAAEKNAAINHADCIGRAPEITSNPARVRLELTNKCNLICTFCYRSHFRTDEKSNLTPDDIKKLDPVLRTAKYISLQQKTETLASPHVTEILDIVGQYDAVKSINTNLLPLTEEMADALVRNKVTFVTISVSIFDESYEKMYRGGKFERLVANVEMLNAAKRRHKSELPRLRMSFVLRPDTVDQLVPALKFCKQHNFAEGIQVLSFLRTVEEDRPLEPALHWDDYEEPWQKFKATAKEMSVPVEFDLDVMEGMRPQTTPEYIKGCFEPWETLNISPAGNVIPCVQAAETMGNIRDADIMDIWKGDAYRKFRDGMNATPYNTDCADCYHCRFVSPLVRGAKLSTRDKIYGTYYRRGKTSRQIEIAKELETSNA